MSQRKNFYFNECNDGTDFGLYGRGIFWRVRAERFFYGVIGYAVLIAGCIFAAIFCFPYGKAGVIPWFIVGFVELAAFFFIDTMLCNFLLGTRYRLDSGGIHQGRDNLLLSFSKRTVPLEEIAGFEWISATGNIVLVTRWGER